MTSARKTFFALPPAHAAIALAAAAIALLALAALLAGIVWPPTPAEAQTPQKQQIEVTAIGDAQGVKLQFWWPDPTGCTGCAAYLGVYRYKEKGAAAWAHTSATFNPEHSESHHVNGFYTFRLRTGSAPGLQAGKEYVFEVEVTAQRVGQQGRFTWADGTGSARTVTPPTPIAAVPNLRGGPGQRTGTWYVHWSEGRVCSAGCTHYEVGFRRAADPDGDNDSNWLRKRVARRAVRTTVTFDSSIHFGPRRFTNPLLVEVSFWDGSTLRARSRTTVRPARLGLIALTAVGPDGTSEGVQLRQAHLSWEHPVGESNAGRKYRLRYTEDNPDSASARWSSWIQAGNWSAGGGTAEPPTNPLTLPKGGKRYTIELQFWKSGTAAQNNRALVYLVGRAVVRTYLSPEDYQRAQRAQDEAQQGPIAHAVWCDVVDGEGVCLTLGGGTYQPVWAKTAAQIANGAFHHCAVDAEGQARCWGDDTYGQVSGLPREHRYAQVGAGWRFSCGLTVSGEIHCWGANSGGQTASPEHGSGPWVWLSVGNDFACALDTEGRAVCWGGNGFGQLEIPPGLRFGHLAAGGYHVCAITTAEETVAGARTPRRSAGWG